MAPRRAAGDYGTMIEVHYRCAFGNNLFQYALGRILAEHRGYALECSPASKHTDVGQLRYPTCSMPSWTCHNTSRAASYKAHSSASSWATGSPGTGTAST